MRLIILSFLAITCFAALPLAAQSDIVGRWIDEDESAHIEIYQTGNTYEGKIVWLAEPNEPDGSLQKDNKNPDKSLRDQPILNLVILRDFKNEGDEYTGGTVYDAERGKTYNSKMWLADRNTLKLRGYWGPFYRTAEMKRVE